MRGAPLLLLFGFAGAAAGCGDDWQLSSVAAAPGDVMTRFDVPSAKCIDGSPAVYYLAANASSDKYIVWLEGGGSCQTLADCKSRANGALGSSKGYGKTQNAARGQLQSDPEVNPDFATWNRVFVPYCSGDLFAGRTTQAINPWALMPGASPADKGDPWKGYFSGHTHVAEVLADLKAKHGAGAAGDVILSGCSAGGIGTFFNCDFMAEQFPTAKTACRPEGGWFGCPIATYKDWKAGKGYQPATASGGTNWLYFTRPFMNETAMFDDCMAHTNGGKDLPYCDNLPPLPDGTDGAAGCCNNVPNLYPFMKTPMFISQNTMDAYQVVVQGGASPTATKYIKYLQGIIAGSLSDAVVNGPKKGTDGLFGSACLQHCPIPWSGKGAPEVDGLNDMQAFGDWYFGKSRSSKMHLDNSSDPVHYLSCAVRTDY